MGQSQDFHLGDCGLGPMQNILLYRCFIISPFTVVYIIFSFVSHFVGLGNKTWLGLGKDEGLDLNRPRNLTIQQWCKLIDSLSLVSFNHQVLVAQT